MARFLLTTLSLLSSFIAIRAQAQDLCQTARCSQPQQAIQNSFNQAAGFESEAIGHAYSGACYHIAHGIKPDDRHQALSLLEMTPSGPAFRAVFLFFGKPDQYTGFTYEQAQTYLDNRGAGHHPLQRLENSAVVEMTWPTGTIKYWMKTAGPTLYLLSRWQFTSGGQLTWCELNRH